ncbi:MAG: CDP-alcohol phosphatidyltransferase family protein [Chthoniobacterales bacterium]
MIPVFVLFAVYYGRSVELGTPVEFWRYAAIGVFIVASVSDALDGWVARRFNQRSRLGALLDPLADKGLLLSAIITLSVSPWHYALPLWFPVLVIARDVVIVAGCVLVRFVTDELDVKPSWTGKVATALQMVAVAWVMLQIPHNEVSVWAAGVFTLISGIDYVVRGIGQFARHEAASPVEKS